MAVRLVGSAPIDADDRAFATLVSRVEHEVKTRYVDEIGPDKLQQMREGAIRGMLSVLDPHYTVYYPPEQRQMFMQAINGNFQASASRSSRDPMARSLSSPRSTAARRTRRGSKRAMSLSQ